MGSSPHAWFNTATSLFAVVVAFSLGTSRESAQLRPAALRAEEATERSWSGANAGVIDDGSITSYKLADHAVTRDKIATGAIGREQLAPGSVSVSALATGAVDGRSLATGSLTTTHLQAGSITSRLIADGAVTRRALARGAVGHSEIGDGAVDGTNIADGAVTAAKLAPDAWLSSQAAQGRVVWGEVWANGTAAVDGAYASVATGAAGGYELRFARPFTRPPVVYVSATSYALCWGRPALATRHTVAVECRAPGLTRFPSGLGEQVEAVSVLKQHGEPCASGFTFIAMESAPGSPS